MHRFPDSGFLLHKMQPSFPPDKDLQKNIQNENLSSSKKRGAKSIPEKPSISQRIKLKNLLESSGYTLSIPLEYLNSFDVDCIIKYITTQSIDLGDERIYNYVHKSNLN